MAKCGKLVLGTLMGMVLPVCSYAQGVADSIGSMQSVLDQLYNEMIPLCSQLIGVGRGIAGFAAVFYIGSRVWRHIANAEPVDFYPLFRPFVLGFCILIFPSVIAMINGIMQSTVTGTAAMMTSSNRAIERLLAEKEKAVKESRAYEMFVGDNGSGDKDKWLKYTGVDAEEEGLIDGIGSDISFSLAKASYNFRNSIKQWMTEVLNVLYEAAALCINTLRTFQLIVLAILGPLVFGMAVFDGFQHTLTAWLAKYINIYLWLPVANIFGAIINKIQENMLKLDVSQIHDQGDTFFSATDTGYLIFMIIGIVGYFTVPSVAGFIINAGGGGAMGQKVSSMLNSTTQNVGNRASSAAGALGNIGRDYNEGYSGKDAGSGFSGAIGRGIGTTGSYMANKISGSTNDAKDKS